MMGTLPFFEFSGIFGRIGGLIKPGSVFDAADSPTNICFVKCKELGFPGAGFLRQEPKKIIFLCEEYFDRALRDGEYTKMTEIGKVKPIFTLWSFSHLFNFTSNP